MLDYETFLLQKPKNSTQEVLLHLIDRGSVSIFDFSYLSGFRTRISDLKLKFGLNLITELHTAKNKFNRTFTYAKHILPDYEKEKAKQVYKSISNYKY